MSLKAFHVVFVAASIGLMLLLGGWCLGNYREGAGSGQLAYAGLAFAAAGGLLAYGRYFLRKLKDISYL